MSIRLVIFVLALHGLSNSSPRLCAQAPQGTLRVELSTDSASVFEDDMPVLTFQRSETSKDGQWLRANYVHPLHDLAGGIITEDFPDDHGHHRGVFWAWHQVLVDDQPIGDAWICQDFLWDVRSLSARVTPQGSAILTTNTLWKSPKYLARNGRMKPFVREQAKITVHPRAASERFIDFDISLLAMVDNVSIGGSDDDKGYGGFSPRIRLTPDLIFSSQDGVVEPQKTQLQAGPWIDITNQERGIAILTHPENPGAPEPWILRRARSMQNVAYPGRQPVGLSTTNPLRLRYRLLIHEGKLDAEAIAKSASNFAGS